MESRLSVVAVNPFATFVALLRFNRQRCDRTRFQATQRNRLAGFLAIAGGTIVGAGQGFINLGDQFALAVSRAKLNCSIRLRRSTVSKIRMILVFFLKVLQCFLGFLENILPPSKQLRAKIFALALVHKRFLVGWSIIFG